MTARGLVTSLPYGLPSTLMEHLHRAQHTTAWLVTHTHKCDHITPVLYSQHWLPVICRSQYKTLVCAHKAIHGTGPRYLEELAVTYPTRALMVPQTCSLTYSKRCFRKAAATQWNNLPVKIRKCKTHTFSHQFFCLIIWKFISFVRHLRVLASQRLYRSPYKFCTL